MAERISDRPKIDNCISEEYRRYVATMCGHRTQVRRAFQLHPTHRAACYFRANTPEPYIEQKMPKLVDRKPSPVMSQDLCPNGSIAMIDYQPILSQSSSSD